MPRAVGTSASRWDAERLLDDLGLLRFFDVMVTADDVMLGKPDPEVWVQVARRLRVPAARCVVFEDALGRHPGRPRRGHARDRRHHRAIATTS